MSLNNYLTNMVIVTEMAPDSSSVPKPHARATGKRRLGRREEQKAHKFTLDATNQFFGLGFFCCRVELSPALCRAQPLGWTGSWWKLLPTAGPLQKGVLCRDAGVSFPTQVQGCSEG